MNSLSLLIYLAEVAGSLRAVVGTILFISIIFMALMIIMAPLFFDADIAPKNVRSATLRIVSFWWVLPLLAIAFAFIPSPQTIYLVAASEAGETVVTSPAGQEMLDDIQKAIRLQLRKLGDE